MFNELQETKPSGMFDEALANKINNFFCEAEKELPILLEPLRGQEDYWKERFERACQFYDCDPSHTSILDLLRIDLLNFPIILRLNSILENFTSAINEASAANQLSTPDSWNTKLDICRAFAQYFPEFDFKKIMNLFQKIAAEKINSGSLESTTNTINLLILIVRVAQKINPKEYGLSPTGYASLLYKYLDVLIAFSKEVFTFGTVKPYEHEKENFQNLLKAFTGDDVKNALAAPIKTNSKGEKDLDALLEDLNALVGLAKVKEEVANIINLVKMRKLREEHGLKQIPMSLHLVFSGNPGTGKTTVARILASIYKQLGVLSEGQLVETDRSGLVAGYVGQTALKTQEVIQKAKGGVLFIDEAYTLANGKSENDYGQEAIDTILKAMEDLRGDFIVIVAGYPDLMKTFLKSNPGLESRFNTFINFEDYDKDELFKIFLAICESNNYDIPESLHAPLKEKFASLYDNRDDSYANARTVRNFFENALKKQANRLAQLKNPTKDDLVYLQAEDLF